VEVFEPASTRDHTTATLTSPRHIAPARTAQKTSLPLLRVLSLPGKQHVHRAAPYQRLLYCRLFTQLLPGNGPTCHNFPETRSQHGMVTTLNVSGPGSKHNGRAAESKRQTEQLGRNVRQQGNMSRYETNWIPSMDTTTRLRSAWIEEPGKTSQETNGHVTSTQTARMIDGDARPEQAIT
jgi:hypothetical protein